MQAIILAGGKGTRLKPLTNAIPKPLVPIGDMPILEVVFRQLHYYGVSKITLAVNHLAHLMKAFFGDGQKYGLDVDYSVEDIPLGTAGPLKIINQLNSDFIVMNGDLLTTIDFGDLYEYHIRNSATITIATYKKKVKIDLGVLETLNEQFIDYIEKPTYLFTVSMGIYVMNKDVLQYIPDQTQFDIPDLVKAVSSDKKKVLCYEGNYEWLDIGRIDDYETAVNLFEKRRSEYLPE